MTAPGMLACRGLLTLACREYTGLLKDIGNLLKEHEQGEVKLQDYHYEKFDLRLENLRKITCAKDSLKHIVPGHHDDFALLRRLQKLIGDFEVDILLNMKTAAWGSLNEEEAKALVCSIRADITHLVRSAGVDSENAEAQLRETIAGQNEPSRSSLIARDMSGEMAVVSLDAVGYTRLAEAVENIYEDAAKVRELNHKILGQIHEALKKSGLDPAKVALQPTGDGALLYLPELKNALDLAREIVERENDRNFSRNDEWRQWTRIGIAFGQVAVTKRIDADGSVVAVDAGGFAIIEAVRLQTVCGEGGIAISEDVLKGLHGTGHEKKFSSDKSQKITIKKKVFTVYHYPKKPKRST